MIVNSSAPSDGRHRVLGITDREIKHTHARYAGECCLKMHRALAEFDAVAFEGVRNPW